MDVAQYLTHLGYGDPTYTKDPVSFLKQYKKYYPFANEETYQKYPTTDKFRDLSPASKQYQNIDQPNFKNFNKIYKQKLRDQELMSLDELQSQSEGFSQMWDKEFHPFGELVRERDPEKYNDIMSEGMTPKMSQSSIYSLNAPRSFYSSIKSFSDRDRQNLRSKEGESNLWKAKYESQLPVIQEYKNYRRDFSPIRKAYPDLHQENTGLRNYVNKIQTDYNDLSKKRSAINEFMRLFPGTKEGSLGRILSGAGPLTNYKMNPYPYYKK